MAVVKGALSDCIVYAVLVFEMHFSQSAIISLLWNQVFENSGVTVMKQEEVVMWSQHVDPMQPGPCKINPLY